MTKTHISSFLADSVYFEEDTEEGLDSDALYGLYISWCRLGNKIPAPDSVFAADVQAAGLTFLDRDGIRVYPGLRMVGPAARDYVMNSFPLLEDPDLVAPIRQDVDDGPASHTA
ncbi:hypothetical protein ACIQTZ_22030 [Paenarthrobacter sp. NPDC090520]|uniref:hypothetical protein n=1 Tax=Paenarthrobacter sp. NPDC090520 TaxID=3364382 RepID=UPI0037FD94B0